MTTTTQEPVVRTAEVTPARKDRPKRQPPYNVVLLDDDDHTYDYVIGMLRKLFGCSSERAYRLAEEVDQNGRVIVDTTTLERAEFKRDQVHAFGRDWRVPHCQGSMTAALEPAVE